jgi:hypothetical protein
MTRVGRVLTIIGITWAMLGLALMITPVRNAVNANPAAITSVFVVGLLGTLSIFAAWGLALYHWGTRGHHNTTRSARWGVWLIVFSFVAAWVYWMTQEQDQPRPATLGPA